MSDEKKRVDLTVEEALAALPDGEQIHTYRNPAGGVLIGVDWDRADAEAAIRIAKVRTVGGEQCMNMGHGLAIEYMGDWLFMQHKEGALV